MSENNSAPPCQPEDAAPQLNKSHGRHDLIVLSLAFFFIFLGPGATQQFLIPFLSDTSGFGHQACSWVPGSIYLSAMVWALLCGYTVRWLGARLAIVLGLATYAGFSACVYVWPSYWVALAAAVAWGWGAAAVWVSGPTRILENQSPFRRGRASGVFFSAVFLGQALGVIALGQLADARMIFGVAAAIGVCGVACACFVRAEQATIDTVRVTDTLTALRGVRGAILCALVLTSAMGFGVVLSPLCSSVESKLGFGRIATLTIWFYVGRLLIGWIAGWLTDTWGRIPVLATAFFLGAAGLGLATTSSSPTAFAAAALTLGIQAGMFQVPTMALVGDWIEPSRRHLAFGALYAAKNIGISFAIIFGQMLPKGPEGNRAAFAVFGLIMAVCGALTLVVGRMQSGDDAASE